MLYLIFVFNVYSRPFTMVLNEIIQMKILLTCSQRCRLKPSRDIWLCHVRKLFSWLMEHQWFYSDVRSWKLEKSSYDLWSVGGTSNQTKKKGKRFPRKCHLFWNALNSNLFSSWNRLTSFSTVIHKFISERCCFQNTSKVSFWFFKYWGQGHFS